MSAPILFLFSSRREPRPARLTADLCGDAARLPFGLVRSSFASSAMRSDICGECGQDFVWDSDAGSAVCMGCGNLQDPNQVLLDAHIDTVDKPEDRDIYRHTLPTRSSQYLKGSHSRAGWTLAGESKRVTHESNKVGLYAMYRSSTCS